MEADDEIMSLRQTVADTAKANELANSLGADDILEEANVMMSPVNIVLVKNTI